MTLINQTPDIIRLTAGISPLVTQKSTQLTSSVTLETALTVVLHVSQLVRGYLYFYQLRRIKTIGKFI